MTSRQTGQDAESIAAKHIQQRGYKVLKRNYYSPFGEIDIIGQLQNCIIFFEVRYRRNADYGSAAASVSLHKQQRIIKTAAYFLTEFSKYQNLEARFDVIGIEGNDKENIEWLEAAFTL